LNNRPRNNKSGGSVVRHCFYSRVTLTAQDITEIHERFHSKEPQLFAVTPARVWWCGTDYTQRRSNRPV